MDAIEWQYIYDERAAIHEFGGGMSRKEAEDAALAELYQRGCPQEVITRLKKTK